MSPAEHAKFVLRQVMKQPSEYIKMFNIMGEKEKTFNRLSFYNGNIPVKTQEVLTRVREQSMQVVYNLIPLYQLGFRFDVALAGGAVRDILLGSAELIKDIDIIISVKPTELDDVFKNTPLSTFQTMLGLHDSTYFEHDSFFKTFFYLVGHCLEKEFSLLKSIHMDNLIAQEDVYNHVFQQNDLEGVIKFDAPAGSYPMDILIIPKETMQYVNENFNFSICKAWINLLDRKLSYEAMPYDHFTFLNQLFVANDFLDDVMRKTITLDMPRLKHEEVIERSIKEHLPRILAKHSEYKLTLITGGQQKWEDWKTSYENYTHLQNTISVKDSSKTTTPRLKI